MKAVWIHIPVGSLTAQSRHSPCACYTNQRTGWTSEGMRGRGRPPQAWPGPLPYPTGADMLCSSSVAGQPRLPLQPKLPLQLGLWVTLSPASSSSSLSWTSRDLPWLRHAEPR